MHLISLHNSFLHVHRIFYLLEWSLFRNSFMTNENSLNIYSPTRCSRWLYSDEHREIFVVKYMTLIDTNILKLKKAHTSITKPKLLQRVINVSEVKWYVGENESCFKHLNKIEIKRIRALNLNMMKCDKLIIGSYVPGYQLENQWD